MLLPQCCVATATEVQPATPLSKSQAEICPACGGLLVVKRGYDLDPIRDLVYPGEMRVCTSCGAQEGYDGCWILPGGVLWRKPGTDPEGGPIQHDPDTGDLDRNPNDDDVGETD